MKKIIVFLFVLIAACSVQAQDSLPLKKWQKKKLEVGLTASAFFTPHILGQGVTDDKSRLAFGVDFIVNCHITKHLGLTWGLGGFDYKKSFYYVHSLDGDTAYLTMRPACIRFPISFLWDINPDAKVKFFINAGLTPSVVYAGYQWESGDRDGTQPSRLVGWRRHILYNLRAGIKIPIYKSLNYMVMLSYENTFVPMRHNSLGDAYLNTESGFLSLHMGLSF